MARAAPRGGERDALAGLAYPQAGFDTDLNQDSVRLADGIQPVRQLAEDDPLIGACVSERPRALYCTFPAAGVSSGCPWSAAVASREATTSSPAAACSTSGGIIGPSPDGSAMPSSSQV
jgi:hypothetical protein